jgi:hypothetical protein
MRSRTSALRDFTADRRTWMLTAVAVLIGTGAAGLAVVNHTNGSEEESA